MRFKKLNPRKEYDIVYVMELLYKNELVLHKKIRKLQGSIILLTIGILSLTKCKQSLTEEKEKETK